MESIVSWQDPETGEMVPFQTPEEIAAEKKRQQHSSSLATAVLNAAPGTKAQVFVPTENQKSFLPTPRRDLLGLDEKEKRRKEVVMGMFLKVLGGVILVGAGVGGTVIYYKVKDKKNEPQQQ